MSTLKNNSEERRFEMIVEGHLAKIDYSWKNDKIYLIHTEVPPAIGGQGVGTRLVEATLNEIARQQWQLVPLCPFVRSYLRKHREWNWKDGPLSNRAIGW